MERPVLKNNEFAVGQAEFETGIILKQDGSYYKNTEDITKVYKIFDSVEKAKSFVIKTVQDKPAIECWISNSAGETVFVYDKDGERRHN